MSAVAVAEDSGILARVKVYLPIFGTVGVIYRPRVMNCHHGCLGQNVFYRQSKVQTRLGILLLGSVRIH